MARKGRFTARRSTQYISERAYIEAAWRAQDNSGDLTANFWEYAQTLPSQTKMTPKRIFIKMVEAGIINGLTPTESIKRTLNSAVFTPYRDRAKKNAIEGLKEYGGYGKNENLNAFQYLKQLTGWREKFNIDQVKYDKEEKMYFYKGIAWNYRNSPKLPIFYKRIVNFDNRGNEIVNYFRLPDITTAFRLE